LAPIAASTLPEYPCSHCIHSGAVAGVIKAAFGTADLEIAETSPAALA
jgi:hypothetical protein